MTPSEKRIEQIITVANPAQPMASPLVAPSKSPISNALDEPVA